MAAHAHEIHEKTEQAHQNGHRGIGLTIAVVAVLSAIVAMQISHTSTDKVILETKIADWWAYTHSNDTNARLYAVNARIAELTAPMGTAAGELRQESEKQRKESAEARLMAQKLEQESAVLTHQYNYYAGAELLLQFSVVLCSVALLTEAGIFWRTSFATTALGVALAAFGFLSH